jgi:hypothetical protein
LDISVASSAMKMKNPPETPIGSACLLPNNVALLLESL